MGEKTPDPYHDYANEQFKRADGTTKGKGWLGVFPITHTPDPGVTSEFSIADSREGPDYPSIVPNLNASELNRLLNTIEFGGAVPSDIHDKALLHSVMRESQGRNVFAQPGEQRTDLLPMFRRIK